LSSKKIRPRWWQDKLAYARLLRLQGYRGKTLKTQLYKMELKEAHALSLLSSSPVEPKLRETKGPDIDLAWVTGDTCSETFDCLSFADRWYLFLLYHREKSHAPLATINRRRKAIKEKLRSTTCE